MVIFNLHFHVYNLFHLVCFANAQSCSYFADHMQKHTHTFVYPVLSIYLPIMSNACWGPRHMRVKLQEY